MRPEKPLRQKAYGSIPHLPNSRIGPGDHHCSPGQARICTEKARDRHDQIIVQEKLDGSCTAVARVGDEMLALGRAGYLAETSPYEMHQLFAQWVKDNERLFWCVLEDGERLVGEWLAQAHGTRYALQHEPWVAFDLIAGKERLPFNSFCDRVGELFETPHVISVAGPITIETAMARLGEYGNHGALDPVEGIIYRVERRGKVDFLAKYVRPDKADGFYLPNISGNGEVWNWQPE